jgi:putative ABC transport system permease protein
MEKIMFKYLKSALKSIWSNKVRSFLTLLGVIIGVTSVTILIALGQGLKSNVSNLIEGLGSNVIAVVGGKINTTGGSKAPFGGNPTSLISGNILTLHDLSQIRSISGVAEAVPISIVSSNLEYNKTVSSPVIFGTDPAFIQTITLAKLKSGRMFTANDQKVIDLSDSEAVTIFGAGVDPIGKVVQLGGQSLTVIGTLGITQSGGIFSNQSSDFSLIPFNEATSLNKGQVSIMRILARSTTQTNVQDIKQKIHDTLFADHHQVEDFSVLTQDDILGLFDQFLNLATSLVSAIAAISLLVGGIGIMNIMLVTVTERTREIGLRKAVGATKRAILSQFLIEAIVITVLGGLLGIVFAYVMGMVVQAKTTLAPQFSWQLIALSLGVSVVIGIIFGIWPAWRAANKDPIESLRYE